MTPTKLKSRLAKAVCILLISSPIMAIAKDLPEVTVDGLELLKNTKMAVVYAKPGASLAPYKKVILLDAFVAFKKDWERDQRRDSIKRTRISPKQIEGIKNTLAEEFHKVFIEELSKAGYEVVSEAGLDVMTIRPAIINLDVNAPDVNNFGRVYTASAGEMTLYLELYDSTTSDLFAKVIDRRNDRDSDQFYTWSNSTTNRAAADHIISGWAKILVNALNDSKSMGDR